jgi:hypothetical protein
MKIGLPDFAPRFGVERDHESAWRGHIQFAVVIYGSGFEARIASEVVDGFSGIVGPSGFEAGYVGGRDRINPRAGE